MMVNDRPYGPTRYKEIVRECYIISKNCNTSYADLMNITPTEKNYLLEFITEELENNQKALSKVKKNDYSSNN